MIKYLLNFSMASRRLGWGAGGYRQTGRMESKHSEPGLCACGWWPLPRGVRRGWRSHSGPSHQCPALQCLLQGVTRLCSGEWHIYSAMASRAAGCLLQTATALCRASGRLAGLLWTLQGVAVPPTFVSLPYSLDSPMAVDVLL